MSKENRAKSLPEKSSSEQVNWSIGDLIDFEYVIRLTSTEVSERIQSLEAKVLASASPESDNRTLLKIWLERVRSELFSPMWTPGSVFELTTKIVRRGALLLFLIIGATLASSLLKYRGAEPVNVSAFIALLILLQFGLAVVSAAVFLIPSRAGRPLEYALGLRLVQPLALHFAQTLARYAGSRLDATHRNALEIAAGDTKRIWSVYRSIFRWSLFARLQEWSLAFNIGALLATLLSILFSDRAFGWQTTLQIEPESVYQIVRFTATPWAWLFGEGVGYPSLVEVAGSRITLKDGIRSLSSENLVSWWPFLSLGIVTYGLLPRLVFKCWGQFKTNRALSALTFIQTEALRIVERIRGRSAPFQSSGQEHPTSSPTSPYAAHAHRPNDDYILNGICLVASDLCDSTSAPNLKDSINAVLAKQAGTLDLKYLTEGEKTDPELIDLKLENKSRTLSIVFDSWMPPIEESKRLIKTIRRKLPQDAKISIILLGAADSYNQRALPTKQELEIWSHFVRKLGDPYCSLEPLRSNE